MIFNEQYVVIWLVDAKIRASDKDLPVFCGDRTPSMDSSPDIKECFRAERLRFKKGTRPDSGDEFNSCCNPVVNVSGSTTPSTKP